jgi:hypothetical protein
MGIGYGMNSLKGTVVQEVFVAYWSNVHAITLLLLTALVWYLSVSSSASTGGALVRRLVSPRYCKIIAGSVIGIALLQFILYLCIPNFSDFGEPVIPLLAGNYLHGGPIYADWHIGQAIVGSIYGPYVFLSQIPVLILAPSIMGSKFIGICFAAIALLSFCLVLRFRARTVDEIIVFCALMIAFLASELHYWFWDRPDSLLIAIVALGALVFDRVRPSICLISIGLLAGIATNLKLFAPIYLIPLALACFQRMKFWPGFIAAAMVGGMMFIGALIFPFAIGVSSFEPYISNVLMMRHQGLVTSEIIQSFFYGLVIVAPPLILWRQFGIQRSERIMMLALLGCAALVAVIAGKPGGGTPYMMPLVPLSLYLTVKLTSQESIKQRRGANEMVRLTLGVVLTCASPIWAYSWLQMARQLPNYRTEQEKSAELRELFRGFPKSEMAHNSSEKFAQSDEYYRVQKAYLGQVTHFDFVNYADQRLAGLPVALVYPLFDNCSVPSWILSHEGSPFSGDIYGVPLFDEVVRDRFRTNYELVKRGQYYDVWACRKTPAVQ